MAKVRAKVKKVAKRTEGEKAAPEARNLKTEMKTNKDGQKYVFLSRDKSAKLELEKPIEKNLASEVLFDVLAQGEVPKDLKLQYAESYGAHFINRKGKNACGASKANNLLVVNGIADELKAAGVKGIVQPTKKPYYAIKLTGKNPDELKELSRTIAMILGFTGGGKKKKEAEEKPVKDKEVAIEMKEEVPESPEVNMDMGAVAEA